MASEYTYSFADHISMEAVEDSLALAALATASDHGTVAVSLVVTVVPGEIAAIEQRGKVIAVLGGTGPFEQIII